MRIVQQNFRKSISTNTPSRQHISYLYLTARKVKHEHFLSYKWQQILRFVCITQYSKPVNVHIGYCCCYQHACVKCNIAAYPCQNSCMDVSVHWDCSNCYSFNSFFSDTENQHTENWFSNLVQSNKIWIVITLLR